MPFGKTAKHCESTHYKVKKSCEPEGYRNGRRVWVPKRWRANGGVPPLPASALESPAPPVEENAESSSRAVVEDEAPSEQSSATSSYVRSQLSEAPTVRISFRPCVDFRQTSTGAVFRVSFDSGAVGDPFSVVVL